MTLPRARLVRSGEAGTVSLLLGPALSPEKARLVGRAQIEARLAADRTERAARAEAEAIVEQARASASAAADEARREARAEVLAQWLALRAAEGGRLEAQRDRVIALATALAERLLGAALDLHPDRVRSLADEVLEEARGARRAVVEAHPLDAAVLRAQVDLGGLAPGTVEVREDPALARGAIRLHTDLGTIDAPIGPRLERLARTLRDVLDHP